MTKIPIPTVSKGEDEKSFIGRCMGDSVMNKEYPDNKQRLAVCYSVFRKSKENLNESHCPYCGAGVPSKDIPEVCPKCGKELSKDNVKSESKKLDERGRIIVAENVPIIFSSYIEEKR